jgi:translocation and assembly module TamB
MRIPLLKRFRLRWLGFTLAALVALFALFFAAIQTGPGKTMLASLGGKLASGDGLTVTVSDIGGILPTNMSVGTVTLADPHGEFARVEGLRLVWHPFALVRGTLAVETLDVAKVILARKPDLPSAPAAESTGGNINSSGGVSLPLRVVLDRFAVGEIDIAEPVVGQPAKLGLTASARLMEPARGVSLSFALDRRDADGVVKGTLGFVPETQTLDIDVQGREPEGGLVARLAGMDGLPAVQAGIKGSGPLDSWNGTLNFTAGAAAEISGMASIRRKENRHRLALGINADVQHLLPANLAPLFEGVSEIAAAALIDDKMNLEIETLTARTTGFGASLTGSVDRSAGTADLAFNVIGAEAARFAALLPEPAWSNLHFKGTLRGTFAAPALAVTLSAEEFGAAGYGARGLDVRAVTVPDRKYGLAWKVDGSVEGLRGRDAETTEALGENGTFSLSGAVPAGGAPSLSIASVNLAPLDLRFEGRATAGTVDGALRLTRLNLAALSPLAGRPLQGDVTLDADLRSGGTPGSIRVQLNGRSRDVATGIPALDGLLGGGAALAGAIARSADGSVAVDSLKLDAAGLNLSVNGRIDHKDADLSARAFVPKLERLDPRLEGRAEAEATFAGTLDALVVKARLAVPEGRAMGQPVEGLALHFDARDITRHPAAEARLEGRIGGKPATGTFGLATAADRTLRDLDLAIGSVVAEGGLNVSPAGLLDGRIAVAARNLADLSALALTEISGTGKVDVAFTVKDGKQLIGIDAVADKVRAAGTALDSARIDLSIIDPAGTPAPDGKAEIAGLRAEGLHVDKLTLLAKGTGDGGSDLKLDMHAQGAVLAVTARLASNADEATILRLDSFRASKGQTKLALSAPATFMLADGAIAVDQLAIAAGNGRAVVRGKAGETIDLDVDLRNLPLALAGLANPKLDLSGTLSGTAKLSGPAATPNGTYDLTVSRVSMPDLVRSGVGPLDVKAKGMLSSGRVGLDIRASGPSLSGIALTGSVPMSSGAMDVHVNGSVALGIANAVLATSGARASGTAIIDVQLKGTALDLQPGGTVRISGGRFDDTVNGVTLDGIEGVITAAGRSVTTSLTARTRNGGSVAVKGNVGIDPAQGFPGNIEITLQNAGLVSSELMRLVADGQLAVSGALAKRPRLTGRFDVKSMDINIPDKLPGGADMLEVRHMNEGPGENRTKRSAKKPAAISGRKASGAAIVADLDLSINADNNVFVRGMGMESELGGKLTLKGTSAAPVTVGNFEMRRGRFDVLGRRLDFTRGKVTFNGTTDPNLDFIAETKSADVTTKILVSGLASQPQISFASTPELPQDEIMARMLFNKSAGSLTAGQAVQVAQTIAQFSGGGAGVMENMRRSLGVDSLDVGTDGKGGQVGVAKRLNDRIYLGVRQGTSPGSSKATIDIDITRNIRIQGATGADGGTETGIGMHWDY